MSEASQFSALSKCIIPLGVSWFSPKPPLVWTPVTQCWSLAILPLCWSRFPPARHRTFYLHNFWAACPFHEGFDLSPASVMVSGKVYSKSVIEVLVNSTYKKICSKISFFQRLREEESDSKSETLAVSALKCAVMCTCGCWLFFLEVFHILLQGVETFHKTVHQVSLGLRWGRLEFP